MSYEYLPRLCSPEFREFALDRFPALRGDDLTARTRRGIAEHTWFGPVMRTDEGDLFQLATREMLAQMRARSHRRTKAGEILQDFEENVFPLNIGEYRYTEGLARTIRPDVDDAIRRALHGEICVPHQQKVSFVDGRTYGERWRKDEIRAHDQENQQRAKLEATGRPTEELIRWINDQDCRTMAHVWERNRPAVRIAIESLPEASPVRNQCEAIFCAVDENARMTYFPSERTARIHAHGQSIHGLISPIRKLALAGAHQLDLRSAQLAIVAQQWEILPLYDYLADGRSIWEALQQHLGVGPEAKPLLKIGVYASTFGMSEEHLIDRLANGSGMEPGLGIEAAQRFLAHSLMAALLDARKAAQQRARKVGYLVDAFGNPIPVNRENPAHRALAQQVQSYEMRIMMACFPVLQKVEDLRVLSWLHDGLAIISTDVSKVERQVEQVRFAINREASVLDIPTELE